MMILKRAEDVECANICQENSTKTQTFFKVFTIEIRKANFSTGETIESSRSSLRKHEFDLYYHKIRHQRKVREEETQEKRSIPDDSRWLDHV